MSTQKLSKYVIFSLTVLIATLLSDFLVQKITGEYVDRTYKGIWLEMLIIIIVYYPAFTIIEKLVMKASKEYVKSSKNAVKSSFLGLIIGTAIALVAIFIMFAKFKYNMDPLQDLLNLF